MIHGGATMTKTPDEYRQQPYTRLLIPNTDGSYEDQLDALAADPDIQRETRQIQVEFALTEMDSLTIEDKSSEIMEQKGRDMSDKQLVTEPKLREWLGSFLQFPPNPQIAGDVPCVGNGHWPIAYLLEKLAADVTTERLMANFPGLTVADIQLALDLAAWVMRDPAIAWADLRLPEMIAMRDELRVWQALSDEALSGVDDPPNDH